MEEERVPTEQVWPSYILVSRRCKCLKWTQVVGLYCSGACVADASLERVSHRESLVCASCLFALKVWFLLFWSAVQ